MKDLQRQLAGLREELKLPHVHCNEEKAQQQNIEILKEKLEDTHHDLILNAMIMKDVCSYDNKTPTLKSDLAAMAACLENERKSHEMIKKELESTYLCLSEAKKEADLLQDKHRLETQRLKEELKERKDLLKELSGAVSLGKDKENNVSRISKELKETTLQLEKLQCEKDQAVARSQELQASLQQCRERLNQKSTYNETSEQKIQDLQAENNKLKTNFMEVQQELQQARQSISMNKGTLKNTIRLQKAMIQEKAELIKKLDKLKRELDSETKRANQNKEENDWLSLQLKEELLKNTKYQKKTWKLHSLTKSTSKMLQDQRINEAEMTEMKEMVSKLQTQLMKEKALCSQLETQSNHLQDELDRQLRRNKMLKDELYLQRTRNEAELQTFQQQLQVEKRRLPSQSEAFEEKQAFEETKVQHEQDLQKMKKELLMLTKSYKSSCADAQRYQKLYNDETRHSMALASQLRMVQLHLQMSSYP
ncbi:myosin-11-like [Takifugu rubripes]|uniref:myosin-11-like n=1 Tax=Takifugu rubripes TaxID=31033 RepID=UPI0011453B7F|nr:myosin-11-like [Takifugu rubripes]